MKKFTKVVALLLVLAMAFSLAACTQKPADNTPKEDWKPEKEINLIVPWAAGGAGDTASRLLQEIIQEKYGYTVVVEDITGGSSAVGLTQVMGDLSGYTIGLASCSWLSLVALKTVPFTWEDCCVASIIYDEPFLIYVNKNSKYTTAKELMDAVKANPGQITCGGSGSANVNQTLPVLLAKSVGSSFNYTPFDGGSRVATELAGGHVDCIILKPVEAASFVASGDIYPLGVFGHKRLDAFPDVPTFEELGYDMYKDGDVAMVSFWMANAKADQETLNHVMDIVVDAMQSDKFKEYCDKYAFVLNNKRGDEGREYVGNFYKGIDKIFNELYAK